VLNQHLADIFGRNGGVYRLLRVLEEFGCTLAESGAVFLRFLDHRAQSFKHLRQVGLKLHYRLAEVSNLGPLITEEQVEEMRELVGVVHRATMTSLPYWISTAVLLSSKMILSRG